MRWVSGGWIVWDRVSYEQYKHARAGGAGNGSSSGGSSLRASGRIPPQPANKEQRGWAGSVGDIEPVAANHEVDDRGRFIAKQVCLGFGVGGLWV